LATHGPAEFAAPHGLCIGAPHEIIDCGFQRSKLAVVALRHIDAQALVQSNNHVDEIERIEIQLLGVLWRKSPRAAQSVCFVRRLLERALDVIREDANFLDPVFLKRSLEFAVRDRLHRAPSPPMRPVSTRARSLQLRDSRDRP